jgi:hypothetical protein
MRQKNAFPIIDYYTRFYLLFQAFPVFFTYHVPLSRVGFLVFTPPRRSGDFYSLRIPPSQSDGGNFATGNNPLHDEVYALQAV